MSWIELELHQESAFGQKITFLLYAIWDPAFSLVQVEAIKARLG